ncbi:MAG: outer membrane beta-barrel protein [Alphaproteobacteria bacterium]
MKLKFAGKNTVTKTAATLAMSAALTAPALAAPGDYTPLGFKAGNFTFFPTSVIGVEYDDNLFALPDGFEESDVVAHLKPGIDAKGRLSGGSTLDFYANSHLGFHADYDVADFTDFTAGMRSRAFFSKAVSLKSSTEYAYKHEEFGFVNTILSGIPGDEPVTYNQIKGALALQVRPGRTGFSIGADATGLFFNDQDAAGGITNSQEHRNRWHVNYFAEFAQDIDQRTGFYIRAGGNGRAYTDRGTFADRDSQGFEIVAGARVKATGKLNLDFRAGYVKQMFENSNFDSVSDFIFGGGMTWTPSAFAEIRVDANRSVLETNDSFFSSFVGTQVGTHVSLFPAENITLWGKGRYINRDYQPAATTAGDRDDDELFGEIGGQIKFNRNIGLGAYYNITDRQSSFSTIDYSRNKFMVELSLAR